MDASDLYMIPGLIDQHVHITGGGGEDSFRSRAPEVTLKDCIESGKVGEVHMHMGNGKKGLQDVFTILEETEIPITHFRPTHVQKALPDAVRFANMGGYIDFTAGSPSDTARVLAETADKVPFDRITMSSDSNGSMPRWNEKKELIGMDVARMTTLFDTCRALIQEQHWPIEKAIAPVTETVAKALNLFPCNGSISSGADADILLLRKDMSFHSVMAKGRLLMKNSRIIARGYYTL